MAANNATLFPIRGQEFRLPCAFRDTSGNLITGWTSLTATAYPDNGSGVSVTIAESPANSGVGYIDIPAAQMSASMTLVKATCSNTNSTAFVATCYTLNLTEPTGAWNAQSPMLYEQMIMNIAAVVMNAQTVAGAQRTITKRDGVTTMFAGTYEETTTGASTTGLN